MSCNQVDLEKQIVLRASRLIGNVLDLWKHSNGATKLMAIDEQSNHGVMQTNGFGETNRFSG